MFLRKAALRPIPSYAVVEEETLEAVERGLDEEHRPIQDTLDEGFRELDRSQPSLAGWLAEQVARREDEMAQSIGYFLVVMVYMAFRRSFSIRLTEVDDAALVLALETLSTDEAIRADDPAEVLESDDVLAMGQPALLSFVQHHMMEALTQAGDEADLNELGRVYRAVLVEVIALSGAVQAPPGLGDAAALA